MDRSKVIIRTSIKAIIVNIIFIQQKAQLVNHISTLLNK